jgi:hypothetical protein
MIAPAAQSDSVQGRALYNTVEFSAATAASYCARADGLASQVSTPQALSHCGRACNRVHAAIAAEYLPRC